MKKPYEIGFMETKTDSLTHPMGFNYIKLVDHIRLIAEKDKIIKKLKSSIKDNKRKIKEVLEKLKVNNNKMKKSMLSLK